MPSSIDSNRDNTNEGIAARMEKYKGKSIKPQDREKVTDLPRWVKTALVMKVVDGMTYKQAAERFNKSPKSLSAYARSPAAKKWVENLSEFVEDPVAMAKAYLAANALSVTLDRIAFLEAAVAAGDYTTGDKIARDLQDRMGIVAKKTSEGALSVKIQLGASSAEIPTIEAEWEKVGDE